MHVNRRALRYGGPALSLVLLASWPAAAQGDQVAEFYKGKTVNVLVGVGVGGEYDLHARLVARFIGKHIAGSPAIVVQNMTGAGGLKMANYLYNVAAQDGTQIGMLSNTFPTMQALGEPQIQFDAAKFQWIGSITPTVETMAVWKTAGAKTIEEARKREIVAGATGRGAITYTFPKMLNELLGTKFKIVTGYPGGNAVNVAMERGEVEARNNTWSSWKSTKAQWLKNQDIAILVQAGPKAKDLANVPTVDELAKNEDERRIIGLIVAGTRLGRPLAAAPGAPPERVKALREAFDATMKDPEFLQAAAAAKIEVNPVRGEDMQKVVGQVLRTPKELVERAKAIME